LLEKYRERYISASQPLDVGSQSFIVVPQADKESAILPGSEQIPNGGSGRRESGSI
jgi:hypothetical protein